jgi:hypothetical protein
MQLCPLYLTFIFELCLLGLAKFSWRHFVLESGDFIPKGENVGPKQASVSKVEEARHV